MPKRSKSAVVRVANDAASQRSKRFKKDHDLEKQKLIDQLKNLQNDMNINTEKASRTMLSKQEEISEYCFSLRTKVDTQSEIMIEEIREWNQEMLEKIDKYEQELIGKFNVDEFEQTSSDINALLAEMESLQSKISQKLDDAKTTSQNISKLIVEASVKLDELKKSDFMLRKLKFSDSLLELEHKKFDPSQDICLAESRMLGLDCLLKVTKVRDMPNFKELVYCFINPYADSHQLIAIFRNSSKRIVLVKMDETGKVLKKKTTSLEIDVERVQTVESGFLLQMPGFAGFKRFDYDFNSLKIVTECYRDNLTLNEQYSIFSKQQRQASQYFVYSSHDLTQRLKSIPGIQDKVVGMLASDEYLYVRYQDRVQIHDIEQAATQDASSNDCSDTNVLCSNHSIDSSFFSSFFGDGSQNSSFDSQSENSDPFAVSQSDSSISIEESVPDNGSDVDSDTEDSSDSEIVDKAFESDISDWKLYGDEFIVTFNNKSGKIRLYSQDKSLDMIKEYDLNVNGKIAEYSMSTDWADGLCFFSNTGYIYHNLF